MKQILIMKFAELARLYRNLESTTKKLEKTKILSDFYTNCGSDLYKAVVLSMGTVYQKGEQELGVAGEMVKKIIAKVTGSSEKEVIESFKKTGDLGLAAEYLMKHRKQRPLVRRELTVDMVFDNLRKLPGVSGAGSQEKKMDLVGELLSSSTPEESVYIVRITLGQMRTGVAAGLVRDAIASAFGQEKKETEHVFNLLGDYGLVAERARSGKMKAEIEVGRPINVMLAERGGSDIAAAMESFEHAAVEKKYDGFRTVVHKNGSEIKVFSRRLEDVTRQFPDIVKMARESLKAKKCIVDGETLAVDKKGKALPFQNLSRRIQRKYDIEKMVQEIPVQVNLFDVVYMEGKSCMQLPLRERWLTLKKIVRETENFKLAEHIETKDVKEADNFYKNALKSGEEGVIVKNMDAHYQPGRRVGFWLKVKPIMEPLDLVVTGAEWGEGKRANWFSSVLLACRKIGRAHV